MSDFKKLFGQYWRFGLIAAIAIVLITFISATSGDIRQAGSSYSNAANGYSTWYRMMSDRGIKIDRWQKPFAQLVRNYDRDVSGITLVQVNPQLEKLQLSNLQKKWMSAGNTLIVLGVSAPAWDIPFRSDLESPQGKVKIETTRRFRADLVEIGLPLKSLGESFVKDSGGSAISGFTVGEGFLFIATTPHLAANAYQDSRPNYELLAELVTRERGQVWVDEYIHGYIDRQRKSATKNKNGEAVSDDRETDGDAFAYLANTPLSIVFLNILLGTLVAIWQQNRRFGKIIIPKLPEVDNGEAYIQALSGVLRQANSSEFVLQNIGRAEQLAWQQKLGLGKARLVEPQTLITAWENQTKLPTEDLRFVLQLTTTARRLTPTELTTWLTKVRAIDRQLNRL
jgi:Domain of unknown function (DUF4350)